MWWIMQVKMRQIPQVSFDNTFAFPEWLVGWLLNYGAFPATLAMQHQIEARGRVTPTHLDKPQGIF